MLFIVYSVFFLLSVLSVPNIWTYWDVLSFFIMNQPTHKDMTSERWYTDQSGFVFTHTNKKYSVK